MSESSKTGTPAERADLSYAVNVRDLQVAPDLGKADSSDQTFEHVLDLA